MLPAMRLKLRRDIHSALDASKIRIPLEAGTRCGIYFGPAAMSTIPGQGAGYSGGRLGIAAAGVKVAWVGVSSHTLSGAANPQVRLLN
jgi:hypothetical protein